MTRVSANVLQRIGRTPLVELSRYAGSFGLDGRILAKLEYFNPFGSVKDRIGLAMIEAAEADGRLRPGAVIIEPTSGNTGIGLAGVAAVKGYRTILTMPDTMSMERRRLLRAHGAELALTPGKDGMKGAIAKAEELAAATPGAFIPGQFDNPANPEAHRRTTGPEIWGEAGGKVDALVAGVGSGGTITGVGEYLKGNNPDIAVFAVEPADSPVLSGGAPGPHKIQGIGAGFVPSVLNTKVYGEVVQVRTDDAFAAARAAAKLEGVLLGISAGAALHVAATVAKRPEFTGKTVVFIAPDGGDKYLSMGLFE